MDESISLRLDKEQAYDLEQLVNQTGVSKSSLVREAVAAYLAAHSARRTGSCREILGDLVGCFSGPADLSIHRDYMDGYGA